MIRELDAKLIANNKLLTASDMARLSCGGCAGCSACCKNRGSAIVLDAIDVKSLKEGLNYSFEGLLNAGFIELSVINGVVLPVLGIKEDIDECIFLSDEGKCTVYAMRPGICRMFPLARIYHEDGSFSYFLQEKECERSGGAKIKIAKWLGIQNLKEYEKQVIVYHDALKALREKCAELEKTEDKVTLQREFLNQWFM